MHALWICPRLPQPGRPGGMAPTLRQMQALRDLGCKIDVIDMRGIPVLKYATRFPTVVKLARSADLVHAHFGYCGWLGWLQPKRPLVVSFMGDDLLGTAKADGSAEWFSRCMVRLNVRLARRVQAVIVKSQQMASILADIPTHVIPNGVDMQVFQPQDRAWAREQLGWPQDRLRVLFPGDPANPGKGYPLAQEVSKLAAKILQTNVELIPLWGVPPDTVPIVMNASHAMLMTSFSEGSPNVVKEAMACNVPIVAVPVGDVAEQLRGVSGSACVPRDPTALADALARVITGTIDVSEDGRRPGREVLMDRGLDLETTARRVLAVYHQVLGVKLESAEPPWHTSCPPTPSSSHILSS